ncbi:MAG TPA: nucleotidyltransferase family protein [Puia sp.]|jgi:molybdenum cofactor cytidylyltransferase|nr:nucleotidyltransferase family protein [Puia sp.]
MLKTGIIILAAGNSSRLGRPKQLLGYRGKTLIGHLVDEAAGAGLHPIVVVTGAVDLSAALAGRPVEIVGNLRWPEGMASSILAGVSAMMGREVDAVIIAACDQPYVSAPLFRELVVAGKEVGKGIAGCYYSGTIGIPVLFYRRYWGELLELTGHEGAKKILRLHEGDLATVSFPGGAIDIDTEEDYARLPGV